MVQTEEKHSTEPLKSIYQENQIYLPDFRTIQESPKVLKGPKTIKIRL